MKFKFPIQAGFKLPELMSTRTRSAPKRFDDEVFLPGANNKHTAGRKVDAGHEADPALGLSERESAALHAAERREKIAEKNFIVDDLDDAADAVEDAWRADEELRHAAAFLAYRYCQDGDHDACVCTTTIQCDLKAGMHDELLAHFAFFANHGSNGLLHWEGDCAHAACISMSTCSLREAPADCDSDSDPESDEEYEEYEEYESDEEYEDDVWAWPSDSDD